MEEEVVKTILADGCSLDIYECEEKYKQYL